MTIRLQQYRLIWRSSRTFPGSSPALMRVSNSENLSPMSLPQVKQRIGTSNSIFLLSVALLALPSCTWSAELLRFGLAWVTGEKVLVAGVDLVANVGPL